MYKKADAGKSGTELYKGLPQFKVYRPHVKGGYYFNYDAWKSKKQ